LEKETAATILFHEWSSIRKDLRKKGLTWRQKWNYLFGYPGWSHDGSSHTSEELRSAEAAEAIIKNK